MMNFQQELKSVKLHFAEFKSLFPQRFSDWDSAEEKMQKAYTLLKNATMEITKYMDELDRNGDTKMADKMSSLIEEGDKLIGEWNSVTPFQNY